MKKVVLVSATVLCVAFAAWAQQLVKADQGKPGNQGPWPVTVISGGGGVTTDGGVTLVAVAAHGLCTNRTQNVGTSGIPCPGDGGSGSLNRTDRGSIMIELLQSGETLSITTDGTGTSASATLGIAITSGGTYSDNLAGSVSASCRCTAASCVVQTVECPP